MHIKAVIFHIESALVVPDSLDMNNIRASIGCPPDTNLLEYIRSLNRAEHRRQVRSKLEHLEHEAAASSKPSPDAADILQYLNLKHLRLAIATAGGSAFVDKILRKLHPVRVSDFDLVIGRNELLAYAPDTNAVQLAAKR